MKTYRVYGLYTTDDGKKVDFDKSFNSKTSSLNYYTKILGTIEWKTLALVLEDENGIIVEFGRDGKII